MFGFVLELTSEIITGALQAQDGIQAVVPNLHHTVTL